MTPFKPFNTIIERFQSLLVLNPVGLAFNLIDRCKNTVVLHHEVRLSLLLGLALIFSALVLNAQANSAYYGALNDKAMFTKAQGILAKAKSVAEENVNVYQALQSGNSEDIPEDLAQQYTGSVLRLTNPVLASALGFDIKDDGQELLSLFDELEEHTEEAPPMEDLGKEVKKTVTATFEKQSALIENTASFKLNFIAFARPIKLPSVSSRFGVRHGRIHEGTDFQAPVGTPILASASGRVVTSGLSSSFGNLVEIDHGNGIHTRYAHCSSILVRIGQIVERGQVIAKVGSTGRSTGPHLHFEMLANNAHVNPEHFLPSISLHKTKTVVMRHGFRKVTEL